MAGAVDDRHMEDAITELGITLDPNDGVDWDEFK